MIYPLTEHVVKTARHTTVYLACGEADNPLSGLRLSLTWFARRRATIA
jgi:hypothetical protein